jgi:hypothetical protein
LPLAHVEEVAVTPEGCLLELRNTGPRFITAVRQVIADLGLGGAEARTGRLLAPGDAGPAPVGPVPPAGWPADAARELQVAAAWAVAERGAQELGDLLTLAPGVGDLPPDVAASWDRIRQLSLPPLAEAAIGDADLPRLAWELIDELEERRRLILTSRILVRTCVIELRGGLRRRTGITACPCAGIWSAWSGAGDAVPSRRRVG